MQRSIRLPVGLFMKNENIVEFDSYTVMITHSPLICWLFYSFITASWLFLLAQLTHEAM